MRRLVYLVNGVETTSYAKARELQPTGQLEVRLDKVEEVKPKYTKEHYEKIRQHFGLQVAQ